MKLSELINISEILSADIVCNNDFKELKRTPFEVTEDTLLFDLFSSKSDRDKTVTEIIKSNPAAIITDRPQDFKGTDATVITVKNSRRAYAMAYSNSVGIDYSKTVFIGVTGTNGKTTTATMIKNIFESVGLKVGFIGTGKIISNNTVLSDSNYSMTTPDPEILYPAIKRIENDGCEIIIMEVSSHSLALEKTYPIPFYISIFTGLSPEHMDFHKDMETYFKEKEKLIRSSEKAIINCDCSWGERLYSKYRDKSIGISTRERCDCKGVVIRDSGLCGSEYVYQTKRFSTKVKLKLPGKFNIYNSMFAFAAANILGITPFDIKSAINSINEIEGRMNIIRSDITVVIDYAHTPYAMEKLLTTVCTNKRRSQNVILIFGCGGERDRSKRPQMAMIAEKFCAKIIVTNDNPRNEDENQIINDICNGFNKKCFGVIKKRDEAINYAILSANSGDIVVIAGKGHERYIYDSTGAHTFNEKTIINEAIRLRESRYIHEDQA